LRQQDRQTEAIFPQQRQLNSTASRGTVVTSGLAFILKAYFENRWSLKLRLTPLDHGTGRAAILDQFQTGACNTLAQNRCSNSRQTGVQIILDQFAFEPVIVKTMGGNVDK
jgi:hypothetical protein